MTAIIDTELEPGTDQRFAALRWLWRVVVLTFLLLSLGVIAAAVVVPRATGSTPFTILTGSMVPNYPPGTLVVTTPVEVEDLRAGDVITFQLESGKAAVVTHRVTRVAMRLDGAYKVRTRGDANPIDDLEPVRAEQIRGKVWYAVPHVGRLGAVMSSGQRENAVLVVAGLLLAYAGWTFVPSLFGRRERA